MRHPPALPHPFGRRALLGAASAFLGAGRAATQGLPGSVALLTPGPDNGRLAAWAERLATALGRAATTALRVAPEHLGGQDGVTAANRFAAAGAPDGRTLLVLAGAAAQARLVGDARAKFDPSGWLPVCASLACPVVAGRLPLAEALRRPLRVAIAAAEAPGAAALLALDLLGATAAPIAAPSQALAEQGVRSGVADAVLLPDAGQAAGLHPWFVLDGAAAERDPRLPGTPTLAELTQAPAMLLAACQGAGAAARLAACLVLPALTPSDLVAQWRAAATRWLEEEGTQLGPLRAVAGTEAGTVLAALTPPSEAVLAYREWLLRRLGWRAS